MFQNKLETLKPLKPHSEEIKVNTHAFEKKRSLTFSLAKMITY